MPVFLACLREAAQPSSRTIAMVIAFLLDKVSPVFEAQVGETMPSTTRSVFRLRSFHLSPSTADDQDSTSPSTVSSLPLSLPLAFRTPSRPRLARRGIVAIALGTLVSFIFICAISIILVGRTGPNRTRLASALQDTSRFSPGVRFNTSVILHFEPQMHSHKASADASVIVF